MQKIAVIILKVERAGFTVHVCDSPKDADGMANSYDYGQTVPKRGSLIKVWTGHPDLG